MPLVGEALPLATGRPPGSEVGAVRGRGSLARSLGMGGQQIICRRLGGRWLMLHLGGDW